MFDAREDTLKRIARSVIGLLIYSFGEYLSIVANVGLTAWASATMGFANIINVSFGKVEIAVSIIVLIIDILMREKIGLGTVLDAILVGTFTDMYIFLCHFTLLDNPYFGLLLLFVSLFIMAYGQFMHMSSGLSCGPRDSLMVAIGKRLPKLKIGYVDMIIKFVLIVISLIIGGPIGVGTVFSMGCNGFIMQLIYKKYHFDPRDVKHNGLLETINILIGRG